MQENQNKLNLAIKDLKLDKDNYNPHIFNTLNNFEIKKVKDLICLTKNEVLDLPNIGDKSFQVIENKINSMGLYFYN